MTIDITSFFFNSSIEGGTATSAWATSVGQSKSKHCRIENEKPGVLELLTGMLYKSIANKDIVDLSAGSQTREILLCSLFDKIFINYNEGRGLFGSYDKYENNNVYIDLNLPKDFDDFFIALPIECIKYGRKIRRNST